MPAHKKLNKGWYLVKKTYVVLLAVVLILAIAVGVLIGDRNNVAKENDALDAQAVKYQKNVDELTAELATAQSDRDAALAAKAQADDNVLAGEQKLKAALDEKAAAEEAVKAAEAAVKTAMDEKAAAEASAKAAGDELEAALKAAQDEKAAAEASAKAAGDELEAALASTAAAVKTAQDEAAAAQAELQKAKDELAAAQAAAKDAEDAKAQALKEKADADMALKAAEGKADEEAQKAKADLAALQDQLTQAQQEKAKAQDDLKAIEATSGDLKTAQDTILTLGQELDALTAAVANAKTENDKLSGDLKDAQAAAKAAADERDAAAKAAAEAGDKAAAAEAALLDAKAASAKTVTLADAAGIIAQGGYKVITVTVQGHIGPIAVTVVLDKAGVIQAMVVGGEGFTETYGVGDKVRGEDFIAQFIGKSGAVVLGQDVDAVSGATVSSAAVVDAVNEALAQFAK